jgi:hypothetical protein
MLYILSHIFHGLARIRGFCFRSKKNPFALNLLDFWNNFGTATGEATCCTRCISLRRFPVEGVDFLGAGVT